MARTPLNRVAAIEREPGSGSFVVSNRHVTFALLAATAVLVLANLAPRSLLSRRGEARPLPSCSISAASTSVATWFAEMLLLFLAALLFVAAAHAVRRASAIRATGSGPPSSPST